MIGYVTGDNIPASVKMKIQIYSPTLQAYSYDFRITVENLILKLSLLRLHFNTLDLRLHSAATEKGA